MTAPRFLLPAILGAALLTLPLVAAEEQEPCKFDLADSLIYRSIPTFDQIKKTNAGINGGKAELMQAIAEARQKFWETYPDKPDKATAKRARDNFADLPSLKDVYFLYLALVIPQTRDLTERRGPGFGMKLLDSLNGLLPTDGGIRQAASPEFFDWVEAVRKGYSPEARSLDDVATQSFNIAAMGGTFWQAVAASKTQYLAYVTERDWWEFDALKRIPARFDTRELYASYLYARYNKLPIHDACKNATDMLEALWNVDDDKAARLRSDKLVFDSADLVRKAAKTPGGLLVVTVPPPMKLTPGGQKVEDPTVPMPEGVIGVYSDPVRAFEILATKDDDIRYLKWLLTRQNMPDGRYFDVAHKWDFANKTYAQLAEAFGEDQVKGAAKKVRTAKKRMTSNTVMDQNSIGATRNEPFEAFEDILARNNATRNNAKGYVRMALALNHGLPGGKRKINDAYEKYVSSHNEKAFLDAARRVAAGKPQLTYKNEIENIEREVESPTAMASEPSAEVESSLYLPWKGFPPGSKANYIWRGLQPPKPGSNNFVPGRTGIRSSYSVPAINSEHADVWFTEIVYDYPSGEAHPPHETEFDYPAKDRTRPGASQKAAPAPAESGEQTLTIGGKRLQTHWESVRPQPNCPDFVISTWTSVEVPGELVRKVEDINNCHGYRQISETLLESFQGSRSQAALDEAAKRRAPAAPPDSTKSSSAPFPVESSAKQTVAALGGGGSAQQMPVARQPVGTTPAPAATTPPLTRTLPPTGNAASSLPSLGVTVPQGSVLIVHLAGKVDSSISKPGSSFFGSLDQPLVINGVQIAQRGTPINAQLIQMPNGAGLTLCLTDITVAGRKYALATSQVTASGNPTAQNDAAAAALNQIIAAAGPAAAATIRARQARQANARQVLLNGERIYVPPITPLAFTLAAPLVL